MHRDSRVHARATAGAIARLTEWACGAARCSAYWIDAALTFGARRVGCNGTCTAEGARATVGRSEIWSRARVAGSTDCFSTNETTRTIRVERATFLAVAAQPDAAAAAAVAEVWVPALLALALWSADASTAFVHRAAAAKFFCSNRAVWKFADLFVR